MPRGRRPESKKWTTRSPLFPEAAAASECAGFPPPAHSDCPRVASARAESDVASASAILCPPRLSTKRSFWQLARPRQVLIGPSDSGYARNLR